MATHINVADGTYDHRKSGARVSFFKGALTALWDKHHFEKIPFGHFPDVPEMDADDVDTFGTDSMTIKDAVLLHRMYEGVRAVRMTVAWPMCVDCGDGIVARNPGVCGTCYSVKYAGADTPSEVGDSLSQQAPVAGAEVYAHRRARLQSLVDSRSNGNVSTFASSIGYSPARISQFLSPTYNDERSIGERAARGLEQAAGVTSGWLDAALTDEAQPIYQALSHVHTASSCWEDISKAMYDRTHPVQRRIVYLARASEACNPNCAYCKAFPASIATQNGPTPDGAAK